MSAGSLTRQILLAGLMASAGVGADAQQPSATPTQPSPAPAPTAMTSREEATMMRNACGGDYRTWCRGMRLGGGRALACLADHSESLSQPCREALALARGAK